MSIPNERWVGRIDEKLSNIAKDVSKIERHLEKLNDRTNKVEDNYLVLDIKTKKNCESITGLGKRVNASKLTTKEKVAIVIAVITGIFAIIVAFVQRMGL